MKRLRVAGAVALHAAAWLLLLYAVVVVVWPQVLLAVALDAALVFVTREVLDAARS